MASGETSAQCCRTHSLFSFVSWSLVSLYFSVKSTASLPSSQQSLHLMPSHCVSLAKDSAWECSIGAWIGKSRDKTWGWHLTPYQEPQGNKVNFAKSLSELTGSLKPMWLGVLLDVREKQLTFLKAIWSFHLMSCQKRRASPNNQILLAKISSCLACRHHTLRGKEMALNEGRLGRHRLWSLPTGKNGKESEKKQHVK